MEQFTDDTTLLKAFLAEDATADAFLFHKYFKPLVLFAERITGSLAEAEDIVAEVFAKLLGRRNTFNRMENIQAYLYASTRNAAINHGVSEKRHQAAHQQIGYLSATDVESEEALQNEIIRVEVLQAIYEEIEQLPEQCRRIFKLIFINNLSTEEIAEQLSINPQTVRSQKSRAVSLIRTALLKKNHVLSLLFLAFVMTQHEL